MAAMTSSDALRLSRHGLPIRTFLLGPDLVEIGSDPACDITVHTDGVAGRALLVQPGGGTVTAYDLSQAPGLRHRSILPLDEPFDLGDGFAVTRVKQAPPARGDACTAIIEPPTPFRRPRFSLLASAGGRLRPVHVATVPISVGGAPDNHLEIRDRAVSRYHCRLEPDARGLSVRDLGSTNGTWVDGLRVHRQRLRPGAVLRVGRTELRVVDRGESHDTNRAWVARSSAMLEVVAEVERFAGVGWPVLVRGETGVGKEHVARALHDRGPHASGPFVALNGGGLPRELIESELFGHERGAFTGAGQARRGAFEQADGGTLFLDEVAELPLDLQTRLLRVLDSWSVRRLGGEHDRQVRVRLVCATHQDLRNEVRHGRFRADLFYRVHRMVIEVPPLRLRREDIEPLAQHFLGRMRDQVGSRTLGRGALDRLRGYPWPGNVRELRNVLELAAVESFDGEIHAFAIERALRRAGEGSLVTPSAEMLRETLERYGGNLSATARALGMPRSTLRGRLRVGSDPEP